jgi:hypothetical protein
MILVFRMADYRAERNGVRSDEKSKAAASDPRWAQSAAAITEWLTHSAGKQSSYDGGSAFYRRLAEG